MKPAGGLIIVSALLILLLGLSIDDRPVFWGFFLISIMGVFTGISIIRAGAVLDDFRNEIRRRLAELGDRNMNPSKRR